MPLCFSSATCMVALVRGGSTVRVGKGGWSPPTPTYFHVDTPLPKGLNTTVIVWNDTTATTNNNTPLSASVYISADRFVAKNISSKVN